MGIELCSTLGDDERGLRMVKSQAGGGYEMGGGYPSHNGDPGKFLEILYAKPCILGNICAIIGPQNGSILLC